MLEPDDGKLSRPVLRGPNPSNGVRLLGRWPLAVAADGRYANSIAGKDGFEVCHGCAAEHDLSHWGIAASLSYGYLKP